MIQVFNSNRKVPLLRDVKILCKSSQSLITVGFRFSCDLGSMCPACGATPKQRYEAKMRSKPLPTCIYSRRITLRDSCLHFPSSLENIIQDINSLHDVEPFPSLTTLFPLTKKFCNECEYSDETFSLLVKSKLKIPWKHCTSIQSMKNITEPPPVQDFTDLLSNSNEEISTEQYDMFKSVWRELAVPDLLTLIHIYGTTSHTYPTPITHLKTEF